MHIKSPRNLLHCTYQSCGSLVGFHPSKYHNLLRSFFADQSIFRLYQMKCRGCSNQFPLRQKEKKGLLILPKKKPQKILYCFSQQVSEESCLKTSQTTTSRRKASYFRYYFACESSTTARQRANSRQKCNGLFKHKQR